MGYSISDQYYLKALDAYPFDMAATMENLNYALSYNDANVRAHCLAGVVYMYHLKHFEWAEEHFTSALQGDMSYPDTYKHFSLLKIWLGDMAGAEKLINYAMKVKGMDVGFLYSVQALAFEAQGRYDEGLKLLKMAKIKSLDCRTISKCNKIKSRLKRKRKTAKKVMKIR